MYTNYFGFNEKPFTLTPNPRFIFLSKIHKEAFAHLLYGINSHSGFIELIGEVGTGKTTVLRTLLNQLQEENYRTALIFNPCVTGVELLRTISHEFGLNSNSEYANELLSEFNNFLLAETAKGKTVVLVIDEAQNLRPDVLEQIRLISNLETENDKLIQIILAGQPELGVLLERPELRQLNQRIAVRYQLKSMGMFETRAYIRHRMGVAGNTEGATFTLFATRLIHLYTRGVPRMINILCDRSLLIAYGNERRRITAGVVTRAIKELLNVPQGKRFSRAFTVLIFIAVISIVLALNMSNLGFGKHNTNGQPPAHVSVAADNSVTSTAKMLDPQYQRLQQEIQTQDQNYMHLTAFNAIAERWNSYPINIFSGQLTVPGLTSRYAAKRGLRITAFKGTLNEVILFDLPFFVVTKVAGIRDNYSIAVTSVSGDTLSIAPSLFGSNHLSKNDLNSIATGTYYLVWQNSEQIPDKIALGDTSFGISALQQLLHKAGTYNGAIDGSYKVATAKAVTDFQQSAGITKNESVGELTLAALARYYTNTKVPSLSSAGSLK